MFCQVRLILTYVDFRKANFDVFLSLGDDTAVTKTKHSDRVEVQSLIASKECGQVFFWFSIYPHDIYIEIPNRIIYL